MLILIKPIQNWVKKYLIDFIIVILLTLAVYILQIIFFGNQLKYGFRDGDWWLLLFYKDLDGISLDTFIKSWKLHGIYTYQIFYIGFASHLVGLDFKSLHQITQILKLISAISIYPLIIVTTGRRLLASLSVILYGVAYSTAGSMFMLVTGGYFLAIIFMNFFLISYWLLFKEDKLNLKRLILSSALLAVTLFLNTERMYPLLVIIVLVDFLWLWRKGFKKQFISIALKRIAILLCPLFLVVVYLIYNMLFTSSLDKTRFAPAFIPQLLERYERVNDGNWQLLLYPFASLGSLFLGTPYWGIFGKIDTSTLFSYAKSFTAGPFLAIVVFTALLSRCISRKPVLVTTVMAVSEIIFSILIFWTYQSWLSIDKQLQIHLDVNLIGTPALFGFYILCLSGLLFVVWIKNRENKPMLFPVSISLLLALLFILFTWAGSDVQLIFLGAQRYLTIPAIGSSIFLAGVIVIFYDALKQNKILKLFAPAVFLLLLPVIFVHGQMAKQFFNDELSNAGMNGTEQTEMKNKFWTLVPQMSNKEQSLFYFDESQSGQYGYFNESTILAGFDLWTMFENNNRVKGRPQPMMIRSNLHCGDLTHNSCIGKLRKMLVKKENDTGFFYKDNFYKLQNFYAIRFVGKEMVNVRDEVLKELWETEQRKLR